MVPVIPSGAFGAGARHRFDTRWGLAAGDRHNERFTGRGKPFGEGLRDFEPAVEGRLSRYDCRQVQQS
jgi:hypothetical protein